MKTRSLLVNYPGYPFDLESLLPVHEFACVAGCLVDAGHFTQICDYATPDVMAYLYPCEAKDTANLLADHLYNESGVNPLATISLLMRLRGTDAAYRDRHHRLTEQLARKLARKRGLDFIVFRITASDDLDGVAELSARLKESLPGVVMLAAGALVNAFPDQILKTAEHIDCLCLGELEMVFPALAECIHEPDLWCGLPNLVYRKGHQLVHTGRRVVEDFRTVPSPAYLHDNYPALASGRKLMLFRVEDSRGCASRCHSCPESATGDLRAQAVRAGCRTKPASQVGEEVRRLMTYYGAQVFEITGPGTPPAHAGAVANTLTGQSTAAVYARQVHSGFADGAGALLERADACTSFFRRLAQSGCIALSFQVDTGSQRLLDDYYARGLGVTRVERVLGAARESGMATVMGFTYPSPADDYHTKAETLRLVARTKPDAAIVRLPVLLPGSAWYAESARFGYWFTTGRFEARAARQRTRFPMPRDRWTSMPFQLGRMSASQVTAEHEQLIREIEQTGVIASGPSELPLLARVMGYAGQTGDLVRRVRRQFVTGDVAEVADLITRYNEAASVRTKISALRPYASLRLAVGN